MKLCRVILLAFALFLGSGCVTVPYQEAPPVAPQSPVGFALDRRLRDSKDVVEGTRLIGVDHPIYYFQNFGGGGAPVGLLFGPLGVIANVKMIEAATDQDEALLKGKLSLDPVGTMSDVLAKARVSVGPNDGRRLFDLYPYLLIVKGGGDQLYFSAVLESSTRDGKSWHGRYSYHFPQRLPLQQVVDGLPKEQIDLLKAELTLGLEEAFKLAQRDYSGGWPNQKEISFFAESLFPRFTGYLAGKLVEERGDWVVFLGPGASDRSGQFLPFGYHMFPKKDVRITFK